MNTATNSTIWPAASQRICLLLCWMLPVAAAGSCPAAGQAPSAPRLPKADAAERPRLLAEPFQHPRQLLRLLDIGESELNSFVDGHSISATDEEALLKILFRMPQIGLDEIARWLQQPVPWEALRRNPSARRGEFFLIEGRARRIVRRPLPPRLASLFEFNDYYQVDIATSNQAGPAIVSCRTIPDAWRGHGNLDQRCRVTGMFLKLDAPESDSHENRAPLLFAAPRIEWLPDRVDAAWGVGPDHVLLGSLGMDVSLFDEVRSRNKLPIGSAERECFYALLNAASRVSTPTLAERAMPLQLASLLQHPEQAHGRVLTFRGTIRRITRVMVDERDVRQRYGIDHYYQLDVLVPVGDAVIAVRSEEGTVAGPVYRDSFPLTCCAVSVPQQWAQDVGQEQVNRSAVIAGFFFKMWAYPSPFVASFDQNQRQLSPMIVLHDPVPATATRSSTSRGLLLGVGFLIVLLAVWCSVWRISRKDRRHSRAVQQHFGPDRPPDFQYLDEKDV